MVRLPEDETPHCSGGEWWYYTGTLKSETGKTFGLEAVIFHGSGWRFMLPIETWVSHYAILNADDGTYVHDQTDWLNLALGQPSNEGFDLFTPLVQMSGRDGNDHVSASMADGNYRLELDITDVRGVILHNQTGYVPYGTNLHSFYYSRPQMQASGALTVDGQVLTVQGDIWFDRQWGRDVIDPYMQWDWFSLRLDDGIRIMLFVFRDAESPALEGTYVPVVGEPVSLAEDDFVITPTAWWTSSETNITYPVGWEIIINRPELLKLTVQAAANDQEFDARSTTRNIYWEGLCTVVGTRGGQSITGSAYVELTNYLPMEISGGPEGDTVKAYGR